MHIILPMHAYSNRKALHLQPFHSTINRYSQLKAGAILCISFLIVTRRVWTVVQLCFTQASRYVTYINMYIKQEYYAIFSHIVQRKVSVNIEGTYQTLTSCNVISQIKFMKYCKSFFKLHHLPFITVTSPCRMS